MCQYAACKLGVSCFSMCHDVACAHATDPSSLIGGALTERILAYPAPVAPAVATADTLGIVSIVLNVAAAVLPHACNITIIPGAGARAATAAVSVAGSVIVASVSVVVLR